MTFTRRQLLAQTGIAALTGCTSLGLGKKPGWIDAHVHVWSPDTARWPLAPGFKKEDMKPVSFTPEQLFAHSRPEGVTRIVLIQMNFYGTDNTYMLDMIAKHRGTFAGVAQVDAGMSGLAAHLDRLSDQGVTGLRISPWKQDPAAWLGSAEMKGLWKAATEEGIALCPLINPDTLPLLDKMCAQFPQTTVVVDHFARVGMAGGLNEHDLAALCRLSRHAKVHVKTSAFYALGKKRPPYTDLAPMIRRVRDAFGASRLMWASDCPFQVDPGHNYHDSIALIRDRLDFLTADDKEWLLRKTAEKVYFRA